MNKQELIKEIVSETDLPSKQVSAVLDSAIRKIISAVAEGDKVQFVGFGSFEGKKREARTGRNPKTKEPIEIPACVSPVFKAGKEFKDAVQKQ